MPERQIDTNASSKPRVNQRRHDLIVVQSAIASLAMGTEDADRLERLKHRLNDVLDEFGAFD